MGVLEFATWTPEALLENDARVALDSTPAAALRATQHEGSHHGLPAHAHAVLRARAKIFHRKTMATRVPGVGLWRYTYADYADRVCRLSAALAKLGLAKGDRVGTFAWNSQPHMKSISPRP